MRNDNVQKNAYILGKIVCQMLCIWRGKKIAGSMIFDDVTVIVTSCVIATAVAVLRFSSWTAMSSIPC